MGSVQTGLRKRQQISQANRLMFMWVAGVSVIVGFALVGSVFLVQKLVFNEKVLAEKSKTVTTLKANNAAVGALKDNIRKLNADPNLNALKIDSEDKALQVVLDALPADANSLALGSSLQNKLANSIDGLTLESLKVTPVGDETISDEVSLPSEAPTADETQIAFSLSAIGSTDALRQLLTNFERSIRAIDVTSVALESQNGALHLSLEGHAFYQPPRTVELKEKVIKQ